MDNATPKTTEREALDAFMSAAVDTGMSGAKMKQAMQDLLAEAELALSSSSPSLGAPNPN